MNQTGNAHNDIRVAVTEYLQGMIYGQDDRIRAVMHPLCMQAGHINQTFEFIQRDLFIDAIKSEPRLLAGAPFAFEIQMIDVTGDIAIAKVSDECFGSRWTDYLTLIKHDGRWLIIMKAFFEHQNQF